VSNSERVDAPERLRSRVFCAPEKTARPKNFGPARPENTQPARPAACVPGDLRPASPHGTAPPPDLNRQPGGRNTAAVNSALAGCDQSWNALNSQGRNTGARTIRPSSDNCFHTPSYDPSQQFFVAHIRGKANSAISPAPQQPRFQKLPTRLEFPVSLADGAVAALKSHFISTPVSAHYLSHDATGEL